MPRFVDRQAEIRELNTLLTSRAAQFVVVYGRRRVGKTTLLLNWAQQSERPTIYWIARCETAGASRQGLARALWRWAYPDAEAPELPRFDSWPLFFEQMAHMLGDQPVILIWDEFTYAVESDPSLPSHLQAAWDHLFGAADPPPATQTGRGTHRCTGRGGQRGHGGEPTIASHASTYDADAPGRPGYTTAAGRRGETCPACSEHSRRECSRGKRSPRRHRPPREKCHAQSKFG